MRKMAIALSAIAFALGTAVIPAVAATKAGKEAQSQAAPAKPKKVLVKKAKPEKAAKYASKCKAGQKWDASATLTAGACVKKAKVKASPKATAKAATKKVG